ncbi:MAG: purine-nucleoside phosphorylase [Gemmatimonadales bacterium]|nr:purine-nucleoside phosphorylase [Gemmatimonadales bacterium]
MMTNGPNPASAAEVIRARLAGRTPQVAIVLGSGLGPLADRIEDAVRMPYQEIPGFELPKVEGHKGELVAGTLAGKNVIAQSGRFHLYEGHSADTAALPVRAFAELGVDTLIVTNAAGGIRRTFRPGTLMLIADQLNLTFRNPLFGPVRPGEQRFPDMSASYDPELRALARTVGRRQGMSLAEGVYAGLIGPSYETPAEVRMLERLGADAVGMSTVLEVVAARANGIRCLGISTITNLAAGISTAALSHEEVMETAAQVGRELGDLVEGLVGAL